MNSKNKILISVLSLIICILIVVIIISFTKCGMQKNNKSEKKIETTETVKEVKKKTESVKKVISSDKNYKVYEISKNEKFHYAYEIYNKKGKLVKKEDVQQQGPRIEYVSDKLLSIGLGAGSYVILTQYYDIENDVFSEIYETPLAVHENMVVYVDESKKLIVRDIFDSSKYYKEFKLNFADSVVPGSLINKIKFIEDKKLQVTYISGKKYKEVTEYLVLK